MRHLLHLDSGWRTNRRRSLLVALPVLLPLLVVGVYLTQSAGSNSPTAGCEQGQVVPVAVWCLDVGDVAVVLPTRGMETTTVTTSRSRSFVVDAVDRLPVDGQYSAELRDVVNGPSGSTGDPVLDQFIRNTNSYLLQTPSRSDVVAFRGLPTSTPGVKSSWSGIADVVGKLLGDDLGELSAPVGGNDRGEQDRLREKLFVFVTDETDGNHDLIRDLVAAEGCELPDSLTVREPGKKTGAAYDLMMCAGSPAIYLDMWQYLNLPGGDEPGGLMQTVSDEVMTVWERVSDPVLVPGENVPFWLYEGSQTLPYQILVATRTGARAYQAPSDACRRQGLPGVSSGGYAPGQQISCTHELGVAAVELLVARVGVGPVLEFFRSGVKDRGFDQRFEEMAGIDVEEFTVIFDRWLTYRAEGDLGTFNGDRYRELAKQLLS